MAATYPGVVRPFTVKQDFVQDVDASHINDLQEEVVAIETILGSHPEYDVGLFTTGVVQNNNTVSQRIKYAESGTNHPFVSLSVAGSVNGWPNGDTVISWGTELNDTHAMWASGTDIVIARDGYYTLTANIFMTVGTVSAIAAYYLRIFVGATEVAGAEACYPANTNSEVRLNTSYHGYLTKGTHSSVSLANFSGGSRTLTKAAFQAAFIRGL